MVVVVVVVVVAAAAASAVVQKLRRVRGLVVDFVEGSASGSFPKTSCWLFPQTTNRLSPRRCRMDMTFPARARSIALGFPFPHESKHNRVPRTRG
jgi:hypothetical protein